ARRIEEALHAAAEPGGELVGRAGAVAVDGEILVEHDVGAAGRIERVAQLVRPPAARDAVGLKRVAAGGENDQAPRFRRRTRLQQLAVQEAEAPAPADRALVGVAPVARREGEHAVPLGRFRAGFERYGAAVGLAGQDDEAIALRLARAQ